MTAEAKAVYKAILENGSLDTVPLRRKARTSTESAKSRFDAHYVGRHTQTDRQLMGNHVSASAGWHASRIPLADPGKPLLPLTCQWRMGLSARTGPTPRHNRPSGLGAINDSGSSILIGKQSVERGG